MLQHSWFICRYFEWCQRASHSHWRYSSFLAQVSPFQHKNDHFIFFIMTYMAPHFSPSSSYPHICLLPPFVSACRPFSLPFSVILFHSVFLSVPLFLTLKFSIFHHPTHSVETRVTLQGADETEKWSPGCSVLAGNE